jgi:hypothetical protein
VGGELFMDKNSGFRKQSVPGMVIHPCKPSIQEAEAGGSDNKTLSQKNKK